MNLRTKSKSSRPACRSDGFEPTGRDAEDAENAESRRPTILSRSDKQHMYEKAI